MSISEISIDLERAENNRKRALALLNQPNRINECKLYTHLYLDFLKSAEMKINKMKVLLKQAAANTSYNLCLHLELGQTTNDKHSTNDLLPPKNLQFLGA